MKNRKNPANRQLQYFLLFLGSLFAVWPSEASAQNPWKLLIDAETFAVAVNPKNPRTVYVGGSGRRLYRTYDAGQTWDTLVVEFLGGGWLSNVFVHPVDTNVVIVGGSQLGTVQRSTDNGETWTKVIDPSPLPIALVGEVIVAKPDNTDTLYLGGFSPSTVYRSGDRGATWDSISTIEDVPFICTFTMRTDSTNVILAGCSDGAVHKSVDGGYTWYRTTMIKNVKDTTEVVEVPKIVFTRANPLLGYAALTCFSLTSLPNVGIYRTTDGGETWRHFALADTSMWALMLAGDNDEELFAGGFSAFDTIPGRGVVRYSPDVGSSNPLWLDIDNDIPWVVGDRDVWMMKPSLLVGDPIMYMATGAGFFAYSRPVVSVPEIPSPYGICLSLSPEGIATATIPDSFTGAFTLRCFDMLGRSVGIFSAAGPGTHEFPLGNIPPGRYYLQVLYNGRIVGSALGLAGH